MMLMVLFLAFAFLVIQTISLWAIHRSAKHSTASFDREPRVSILLAARNEEELILRSLASIEALDYPSDKLEVLIGDDDSTDTTAQIISEYIKDRPHYQLHKINSNLGKSRGKANVIAHLAHRATGDFYFITDVDVQIPPKWIVELLNQFTPEVGIVSGTSTCAAEKSLFSRLQAIDWLHFMGYIQSFANLGVACTSVGNNMAVRARSYWDTGGYEHLDFSITEDYKLFKEVTAKGWQWRTILTPDSLGLATHLTSWKEMLHQRKRWLIGAREIPLNWKILIILYGLFIPVLIVLLFLNPMLGLTIWGLKFILQSTYVWALARKVRLPLYPIWDVFFYEGYVLFTTFITALFYISPIKAVWKGRTYSHHDLK